MSTPIRQARIKANKTVTQIASSLGLDKGYLSRLERGLVPEVDFRLARLICQEYGVSEEQLEGSLPALRRAAGK